MCSDAPDLITSHRILPHCIHLVSHWQQDRRLYMNSAQRVWLLIPVSTMTTLHPNELHWPYQKSHLWFHNSYVRVINIVSPQHWPNPPMTIPQTLPPVVILFPIPQIPTTLLANIYLVPCMPLLIWLNISITPSINLSRQILTPRYRMAFAILYSNAILPSKSNIPVSIASKRNINTYYLDWIHNHSFSQPLNIMYPGYSPKTRSTQWIILPLSLQIPHLHPFTKRNKLYQSNTP